MIAAVMVISNLVLTRQIYSAEPDCAHAHNRDLVPLIRDAMQSRKKSLKIVPREPRGLGALNPYPHF